MNEILFGKVAFVTLFVLMLWSWIQALFPTFHKKTLITFLGMIVANTALTMILVSRWIDSGHFPLSNLYESLLFLSWSFTAIHLVCQMYAPNLSSIGAVISPLALCTYAFASFSLPPAMQKATALVPALQSNWLMMHVTIMIFSYSALLFGSLCAFVFLIVPSSYKFHQIDEFSQTDTLHTRSEPPETKSLLVVNFEKPSYTIKTLEFTPFGQMLDNLSYRILGIGFPLLTMGILSGAVWANEAWGSYWSWDPKETWAFITWLVFAIYLHVRLTKGWSGTKPAILATFGFVTVWICYLGVNLLGTGLHSYGWFRGS